MVLSDFLLRQKTDVSNLHEIIPISFSLRRVLCENYYGLDNFTETPKIQVDKYLQTRFQTKSSVIEVPEVHGMDKSLIPHIKPEHQKSVVAPSTCPTPPTCHIRPTHHTQPIDQGPPTNVVLPIPKPRIRQRRAGIRRKPKVIPPTGKNITTVSCASSATTHCLPNPSNHHTASRA